MKIRLLLLALPVALVACRGPIQHGLDERDANEIVTELVSRGFDARKVPEKGKKPTWAIDVPDDKATDALRVLTDLKLPRKGRKTTQALVESASLIETPQAERLRALEAQEGDIEEALETMDGVRSASVELVVPAPPRPGVAATPSKASVLLRVHPEALERLQQTRAEVRALVAAAVDGLHTEDVVLVLDPVAVQAPLVPPALPEAQPAPASIRALVVVMALVLSVLAAALIVVLFRLRKKEAAHSATPPAPASAAAPSQKPVISANVQRKVA
jgi:type III secretion protein J